MTDGKKTRGVGFVGLFASFVLTVVSPIGFFNYYYDFFFV